MAGADAANSPLTQRFHGERHGKEHDNGFGFSKLRRWCGLRELVLCSFLAMELALQVFQAGHTIALVAWCGGLLLAIGMMALKGFESGRKASGGPGKKTGKSLERPPQCGDRITGFVREVRGYGVFLTAKEEISVFIPLGALRKSKDEYFVGEEVEVTVTRPAQPEKNSDEVKGTDRHLKPLDSLQIGDLVTGTVLNTSDQGAHLDVGMPKDAFAFWKHLAPLGRAASDYKKGDTVLGLNLRRIGPTTVRVGAASLNVRPVSDFKAGERLEGTVVDIVPKINAVFFDVGAVEDAAALGRKNQLTKRAEDYFKGEEVLIEVVKSRDGKLAVKDLGTTAPRS